MNIIVPIVMAVFVLGLLTAIIASAVHGHRRMKRHQELFSRMWDSAQKMPGPQSDHMNGSVADFMKDPFQTVNRVFESVAQQIEADNRAPQLQAAARVLSRRQSFHHSSVGTHHVSTSYYITFELESGERMELRLSGSEYGMLVEGDCGRLTYQGSRFVRFERDASGSAPTAPASHTGWDDLL